MEKYYYELTISPQAYYELFLDLVLSLTSDAIEELDGDIIIRSESDLEAIKDGIEAFAKELSIAFDTQIVCDITLQKKENQDWIKAYQDSVKAIEVDKFYIHPSWEKSKENKINIQIDPTLAFGSGHHETTNECLRAISRYVKSGDEVCDVGCGSGILAIAASKLGATVDICDTDMVAVKDALKNFEANDTYPRAFWEGSASLSKDKYDVVIANIVADVLIFIAKDLQKITKSNGIVILSGIMEQHTQKILDKFIDRLGFKLIEKLQQNEWVTLVIKKDLHE